MRFIHTADIHWGMCPDNDKPWSKERAQAIKDSLKMIVNTARERDADLLLISGDLFHRQPLAKDLKEVNYLFSTIPSIQVAIIAGNHDRIRKNSVLLSFSWCPNVTFLMANELTSVYFEEINTEVHGFSYHTSEITENRLDQLKAPDDGRIHILMAHGGDGTHLPFNRKELAQSGFTYIALGHIHKPEVLVDNKMAFCGSPEPLDRTETGKHGMLIGDIDLGQREVTTLRFLPVSKIQYIPLIVNVSPGTTNMELSTRISQEIQKRGSENIYRFRIRGMRDPDITFDLEPLSAQWKIAELIDDSEPQYDFGELFAEHPGDMIGFYIQALQKEKMSPIEKKALHYGINALLHTTDERS